MWVPHRLPLLAITLVVLAVFPMTEAPIAVPRALMRLVTAATSVMFSRAMRYAARPAT